MTPRLEVCPDGSVVLVDGEARREVPKESLAAFARHLEATGNADAAAWIRGVLDGIN